MVPAAPDRQPPTSAGPCDPSTRMPPSGACNSSAHRPKRHADSGQSHFAAPAGDWHVIQLDRKQCVRCAPSVWFIAGVPPHMKHVAVGVDGRTVPYDQPQVLGVREVKDAFGGLYPSRAPSLQHTVYGQSLKCLQGQQPGGRTVVSGTAVAGTSQASAGCWRVQAAGVCRLLHTQQAPGVCTRAVGRAACRCAKGESNSTGAGQGREVTCRVEVL